MSESILESLKHHQNQIGKSGTVDEPETSSQKRNLEEPKPFKKTSNISKLYQSMNISQSIKQKAKTGRLQAQVDNWLRASKCKMLKARKISKNEVSTTSQMNEFLNSQKLQMSDLQVLTLVCLLRHYQRDFDDQIREVRATEDTPEGDPSDDLGIRDYARNQLGKRGRFEGIFVTGRSAGGRVRIGRRNSGESGAAESTEQRGFFQRVQAAHEPICNSKVQISELHLGVLDQKHQAPISPDGSLPSAGGRRPQVIRRLETVSIMAETKTIFAGTGDPVDAPESFGSLPDRPLFTKRGAPYGQYLHVHFKPAQSPVPSL